MILEQQSLLESSRRESSIGGRQANRWYWILWRVLGKPSERTCQSWNSKRLGWVWEQKWKAGRILKNKTKASILKKAKSNSLSLSVCQGSVSHGFRRYRWCSASERLFDCIVKCKRIRIGKGLFIVLPKEGQQIICLQLSLRKKPLLGSRLWKA